MRPIDADALIHHFYETEYASMYYVEVVKRIIDAQPTISPDEVRGVGKWIAHGDCGVTECSVCGWFVEEYVEYNYCPSCGARMSRAEAEKAMEVSEDG